MMRRATVVVLAGAALAAGNAPSPTVADIQAQPYQTGYVLKFQWEDEASAINLYLSSEQAHDLVRRLSGVFASESEGAT